MRGEEESTRTFIGQEALLTGQFGFLDIFKGAPPFTALVPTAARALICVDKWFQLNQHEAKPSYRLKAVGSGASRIRFYKID